MQRIVVHRPGGHARLSLEQAPAPRPAAHEVRVRAGAVGVNYADCVVRMGLYASARRYVGWPIVPGFELAGTVDALGPGVEDLALGAPVLALTRFGAYAEAVCVPRAQVFPLPAGWSFARGAAFPVVHLTAWYALHRLCALAPGARVLVHSAAGGVGGALVQLARAAGLRAVGLVGAPEKAEAARALGCEHVLIGRRRSTWRAARALSPAGYDAVFDACGPRTLRASYRLLAPEGRLVVYGFHGMLPRRGGRPNPLRLLASWLRAPRFDPFRLSVENRAVLGFNLSFLFHRQDLLADAMGELFELARTGALRAPPTLELGFEDAARAHAALESGRTVGKLVLVPRPTAEPGAAR